MPEVIRLAGAPSSSAVSVPTTLPAHAASSTLRLASPRPISMISPAHHLSSRKISETFVKNDSTRWPNEIDVLPVVTLGSAASEPPCQMREKPGAPIARALPTTQNGPVSGGSPHVPSVVAIVAVMIVQEIPPTTATSHEDRCSPRYVTAAMPINAPQ